MKARSASFWVPKQGLGDSEYEDACWPVGACEVEAACIRFAIADGATESCFAGRWARGLARAAAEGRLGPDGLAEALQPLQAEWRGWLTERPLPWYAEEKARRGAFAALALLVLSHPDGGQEQGGWRSAAVGDSCLFQVRDGCILARFPIERSGDFDSRPYLVGSRPGADAGLAERCLTTAGEWRPGDAFLLMSDALAYWFLREAEGGARPWEALLALPAEGGNHAFREWIGGLRSGRLVRDDDCTVLRVTVE